MLTRILLVAAIAWTVLAIMSQHATAQGGGGFLGGFVEGYQRSQEAELRNQMMRQQIENQTLLNNLMRLQIENELLRRQNGLPPASAPPRSTLTPAR
jgi:hypothetical protein